MTRMYGYDQRAEHLAQTETLLSVSVDKFKELTAVAGPAYRTATAMETSQRQIPFRGGNENYPSWQQVLPMYEKERTTPKARVVQLNAGKTSGDEVAAKQLAQVPFMQGGIGEVFTVAKGASLFAGGGGAITSVAPEIDGLKGIRIAPSAGGVLRFNLAKPAQVLAGFVKSRRRRILCWTRRQSSGT